MTHFFTTNIEIKTTAAQADSTSGFYAAEAGLNLRGADILEVFRSENLPTGTAPSAVDPCVGGNDGAGDFECVETTINGRTVVTYVDTPNAGGAVQVRIPPGELFGGLNAFENRYSAFSQALSPRDDAVEALLEMVFRSRVVPIFQFAAFYNKDLEIAPGANMTLNGRVHANGDLYLNTSANFRIDGQVTVASRPGGGAPTRLYRGRKNTDVCEGGTVTVDDLNPATGTNVSPERLNCVNGNQRYAFDQATLDGWNGQIQTGLDTLTVPPLRSFEPGGEYWNYADLRVVLNLQAAGGPRIEVRDANQVAYGSNPARNNTLSDLINNTCPVGANSQPAYRDGVLATTRPVERSNSFYNWRERTRVQMMEVDVQALLNCMHQHRGEFFSGGRGIDETTQGGLVIFFSVFGAQSGGQNDYGVRLRNAGTLGSSIGGAPAIQGLTVVSDQAVYVQGDYNRDTSWRPASIIADSLNLLSNQYNVRPGGAGTFADQRSYANLASGTTRNASNTEYNAAFLAGTDTTGGVEGAGGFNGYYNGGLENYPRLHEDWSGGGATLRYRGSFVSFAEAQHVDGRWCGTGGNGTYNPNNNTTSGVSGCNIYNAPTRVWEYDTRFNDIDQLPPLSPNFVYLRQELFVRQFER